MDELLNMAEEWVSHAGLSNSSLPVTVVVVAVSITATALVSLFRNKSTNAILPSPSSSESASILSQFSDNERSTISRGIHAATTSNDLFALFDNHQIFTSLSLPLLSLPAMDDCSSLDQTFRDLVREKVIINETCVTCDENIRDNAIKFRTFFEDYVFSTLQLFHPTVTMMTVRRLCAHFSRTRAGGDSYFALQEIFEHSPFVITASPHHTHALTTIAITSTSAAVTITSNFDVYFADQLHANDDLNDSEHLPEAIVTLSAVTTEVLQFLPRQLSPWSSLLSPSLSQDLSPDLIPIRRDLAISCFHPSSMWDFHGDVDARSLCSSATTIASTHATHSRSNNNSPAEMFRSMSSSGYIDTVDISTAVPCTPTSNTILNLHKDSE